MICKVTYSVCNEVRFEYFELMDTTDPVVAKSRVLDCNFDGMQDCMKDKVIIESVEACRYVPRENTFFKSFVLVVDAGHGVNYYRH